MFEDLVAEENAIEEAEAIRQLVGETAPIS
jgi:hypothetical protein